MPEFMRLRGSAHSLKGWIMGAAAWFVLSLVVIGEYLRTQLPVHLTEVWFLLSLIWFQFGFAGIFHTVRKEGARNLAALALITLVPPLLLRFLAFFAAWELARRGYLPPP